MRSDIVDTATLLLILQPFQPQRQGHYEAASNLRLFIANGRVPITQLGQLQQGRSWEYKYVRLLGVAAPSYKTPTSTATLQAHQINLARTAQF